MGEICVKDYIRLSIAFDCSGGDRDKSDLIYLFQ